MTVFSGIQPSGDVTLGNYLGAMKGWVELQSHNSGDCLYSVVDQHSLTTCRNPHELRKNTIDGFGYGHRSSRKYIVCPVPRWGAFRNVVALKSVCPNWRVIKDDSI